MSLKLPERTKRPRELGITSLHDVCCTVSELKAILEDYSDYIDLAKFGVGVAAITPRLKQKVASYREAGVIPYFGGTLFEKYYSQGMLEDYKVFMTEYGVDWVEVSCGTIAISIEERESLVRELSDSFTVVAEVGSKDAEEIMPPSRWIDEIGRMLDAGAAYVITEGRQSGTAGVYRASGEVRTGLVSDILSIFGSERLIFEAPTASAQAFFINQVGANVNLGNINPREVPLLEAQRQGLRSETFWVE